MNSRIPSVHKYHQFDKNRVGALGEHVTAMREVRSAFRRVQGRNGRKKHLVEIGVNGRKLFQCN
jgi:hypothetical protein